jgi:transposase-like protein
MTTMTKDHTTTTRGYNRKHPIPAVGTRFGSWTVIGPPELLRWGNASQRHAMLPCRCDCGNESIILPSNLRCQLSACCPECGTAKMVALNASRAKPKPKCCRCGKIITSRKPNAMCTACAAAQRRGRSRVGLPMTLAEIGKRLGITKAAASIYRIKHGDAALLARLEATQ